MENFDLPADVKRVADALAFAGIDGITLDVLEQAAMVNALRKANGNRCHAAASLGIAVRTLQ